MAKCGRQLPSMPPSPNFQVPASKFHLKLSQQSKLAEQFKDKLVVWFAIDGLEDTHSKYRQGTDWKKIIGNAKEFIDRGGRAVWQFIPFQHNEHQMRDCMKMSTRMGFESFEFVKNARYPNFILDLRKYHNV